MFFAVEIRRTVQKPLAIIFLAFGQPFGLKQALLD